MEETASISDLAGVTDAYWRLVAMGGSHGALLRGCAWPLGERRERDRDRASERERDMERGREWEREGAGGRKRERVGGRGG